MATAAARITLQMIASNPTNRVGWPSAVAIQALPSNASVNVTTARASGHSRHHGPRASDLLMRKVLPRSDGGGKEGLAEPAIAIRVGIESRNDCLCPLKSLVGDIHAFVHARELSDEYSATSREMSTAMYSVPVIASVIASVRAPFVSGVMSP